MLTPVKTIAKKKKRTRAEAVLMNIRNRNKTETERARTKAMSGRKVEVNKSDGVKVTDAKVTVYVVIPGQCPPKTGCLMASGYDS